jgi:ParB/RepB/Spo0J family partition protein
MIRWTDETLAVDAIDEPTKALREDIDAGALGELTDDMSAQGLLQPIGVRGPSSAHRYETIWGHRRLLAARSLNWPTIPARVCPWDSDIGLARLAENFQRTDLNPREEALAVQELRAAGRPLVECARLLRRSVSWVESRLALLSWPPDLQQQVAAGALTLRAAAMFAEIDHAEYRKDLVDEARRTGASVATIGVWLAHYHADRDRIISNRETVAEILSRRETFRILFTCECCEKEFDTQQSVLLRVCAGCARTLEDERQANRNGEPASPA